jgi:hypothetical protein
MSDSGEWSTTCPGCFTHVEKPQHTLNGKLQGSRAGLDILKKRKICVVVVKVLKLQHS